MGKGDQLREWIESVLVQKAWSAEEFARRAKVTSSTVSRARRGTFVPSNKTLEKLEDACGIPFGVPLSMQERSLIAFFRALPAHDRATVLRQVRAIAPESAPEIQVVDLRDNQVVYIGPERRTLNEPADVERRNPGRYAVVR